MHHVDSTPSYIEVCAGIGGMGLGFHAVFPRARCIAMVEREAFACEVLAAQMEAGALDSAPIWTDLATFDGRPFRGLVDWIIGSPPCQPYSVAGKQLGDADPRAIWPHIGRIIGEVRPRYVFIENVALNAFRQPRDGLEALGYRVAPAVCISAAQVGAPHLRKRWWCLATDTHCAGPQERQGQRGDPRPQLAAAVGDDWRAVEPCIRRGADGVPSRVDRLRALGNAVVPQAAAAAIRHLLAADLRPS